MYADTAKGGITENLLKVRWNETWHPAPRIPESFSAMMRQYSEYRGIDLSLSWDGHGGFWTLMNKERVWDEGAQGYRRNTCLFAHLVNELDGSPMPLDTRVWDFLEAQYYGQTIGECKAWHEKKKAKEEKEKSEEKFAKAENLGDIAQKELERHLVHPVVSLSGQKFPDEVREKEPPVQVMSKFWVGKGKKGRRK
jgi:hypothetical protein